MEGYSATVKESSRELTAREKIMVKDTGNATRLDEATANGSIRVSPAMYAVISIHNEKSENKDYNVYVIMDTEGNKFATGSASFFDAFKDIWNDMAESGEVFEIEVYRKPSKNYKGKDFLTCSLV